MERATLGSLAATASIALLASAAAGSENPPAPGFDAAGSDPRAVEIADEVMERLGGRDAWDATRYVTWNFFGRRRHLWDRSSGDVRIEGVDRETEVPYTVLMNLRDLEGRAWEGDEEVVDADRLAALIDRGEAAWINDAYWLFMPYKLKDSGVTLRHLGVRSMEDGRPAEVLELTFRDVGRTPENRYHVYVAEDSGLVEQWDFYADRQDPEPRFRTPWHDWRRYGDILLSTDRGDSSHSDVCVLESVPEGALTSPAPVDWASLTAGCSEPLGR